MYFINRSARPLTSGRSTLTIRSKRPARVRALSSMSARLVPARIKIPPAFLALAHPPKRPPRELAPFCSKPSISTRSWLSVDSESMAMALSLPDRLRPMVSISSMKMMHRPSLRAFKKSRFTMAVPTPAHSDEKSDPLSEMKGIPASPAIALAIKVFPVPGGPTRRTPLGMVAPRSRKRSGLLMNSKIWVSSCLASSQPSTSFRRTSFRLVGRNSPAVFTVDRK
mmetsp:Transcript_6297/g.14486  ORF Transcript_6297/g.14486 Transcript_6297/m.14486 type:complete len:224 (-) Transcript_6297:76-747(-)